MRAAVALPPENFMMLEHRLLASAPKVTAADAYFAALAASEAAHGATSTATAAVAGGAGAGAGAGAAAAPTTKQGVRAEDPEDTPVPTV